ncbi:MAG: ubiquinol-cytochrome c reductase cytochrome b subunit, partial [Nocardioides sp.]
GSQPDWYMGWPDGALRIMPGWESNLGPFTLSWNVFIPIIVLPGLAFTILLLLPFIEAWITGDKRDHHLLQRPRNAPTRTAIFVALMTFYGLMWAAGGNDILATQLNLSINQITYFMRVAVFVGPVIAFFITRRWCISLQRSDNEQLLHGYETGVIMRSAEGGYSERHLPINEDRAFALASRDRDEPYTSTRGTDENGVVAPGSRIERVRAGLSSKWYAHDVQQPTPAELEEGHHHAEHEHELQAGLDHPADGHQFDGHHTVDEGPLRGDH